MDEQPEPATPDDLLTYPRAPESLFTLWMKRRRALDFAEGEALPPLHVDLKALLAATVPAAGPPPPGPASLHALKLREIRALLAGQSELAALNAILISHLRKAEFPEHAPALFRRIWTEEGDALRAHLPIRWLISSVITFGEHGETEAQRRIGLSMNMFFSLMKLYEFERFHSGVPPDQPFALGKTKGKVLPMGMPPFAMIRGGLDINLLAQLWHDARKEPIAGALACQLLEQLNEDPRNLFRRIGMMRDTWWSTRGTRPRIAPTRGVSEMLDDDDPAD